MRIIWKIFFFFSFLFFSFKTVYASQEFFTVYDVSYEADLTGKLHVIQNISLTNRFSDIYASSYSLKLEGGTPENVRAEDSLGPAKTLVETKNEETTIKVDFNEKVVGINKTLKFALSYDIPEFLKQNGQVWELTVPKLVNPEDIDEYNLRILVPKAFGKPAYISPSPYLKKTENEKQIFFFNKNQISSSGIIAAFGEFQIFDFSLKYHLQNPENKDVLQKIALPPDTPYQKMSYWEINPKPENTETDVDGNWLAIFRLKPKEELEIQVEGQVKIFANPTFKIKNYESNLKNYLEQKKYWEVNDPEISALGQKLKSPKAIHEYVVKTLEYDSSRVRIGAQRLGAKLALANPERAICTEYTDLFIALARAAGIPAREINGFAYTTNPLLRPRGLVQDVLHSWPEYFDKEKETWVQIDPTWQDTTGGVDYFSKLDLDHFAFVIHGMESDSPAPAGAYKKQGLNQKDINISFGKLKKKKDTFPKIEFLIPPKIYSEQSKLGIIVIKNEGEEAIYDLNLNLSGINIDILSPKEIFFENLPPFSKKEILIKIKANHFIYERPGKIVAILSGRKWEYNFQIKSFVLRFVLPVFGGFLGTATLVFVARKIRGLYF